MKGRILKLTKARLQPQSQLVSNSALMQRLDSPEPKGGQALAKPLTEANPLKSRLRKGRVRLSMKG